MQKVRGHTCLRHCAPTACRLAVSGFYFTPLLGVLFTFPSRYLFAIGLSPIFSFRWNLPPILSCIPKQLDSLRAQHRTLGVHVKDGILTLYDALFQETCTWSSVDDASLDYNSDG